MIFKSHLAQIKDEIDYELTEFFNSVDKNFVEYSEFVQKTYESLVEYTMRGGKRLRPAIIYYTYILLSDKNKLRNKDVLKISIFVELLQSFLLIHDDIMDRDKERRGGPTNHIIHQNYAKDHKFKNPEHFGTSMALLSGDLANQLAYQIIAKSNFSPEVKVNVMKFVTKKISEVIFGQVNDFVLPQLTEFTKKEIMDIYIYKTATYTFEIPCITAALLAEASDNKIKILENYARPVGIAFQIRDDILGLFGEIDKTGKSDTSDIKEGKKTILIWKAYQEADSKQKEMLDKYLGKTDLTESEAKKIKKVITDTGALKYAEKLCKKYVNDAKTALKSLKTTNLEQMEFLNEIADYMLTRES